MCGTTGNSGDIRGTGKQLKAEIRNTYKLKTNTNIIGTAACEMAMHLDLQERVQKSNRGNITSTKVENKNDTNGGCQREQQQQFAKPLLYGSQGEQIDTSSSDAHNLKTSQSHAGSSKPSTHQDTDTTRPSERTYGSHKIAIPKEPTNRSGLDQPRLDATGEEITGANKNRMQAENRKRRRALQQAQTATQ
jgi:hypothetical protein